MSEPYSKVMPVAEAGGSHMINPGSKDQDTSDQVLSEDSELSPEALEAINQLAAEHKQRKLDMYSILAKEVEGKLTRRMGTRKSKENQWLESMRLYLGSLSSYNIVTGDYPFGTKDDYSTAGSNIHRPEVNIVRQKCNIAIAQTVAHQFAAGDKNWNIRTPAVIDIDQSDMQTMIKYTNDPNLTPQQAADLKTDLMEREIENHLNLTNYASEARKSLADRVILGTGVLKGPQHCGKLKHTYRKQVTKDGDIIRIPTYTVENMPLLYRVNIWYWFPDDSVTDVDKAEDAIEAHPMSKIELIDLMKHPGYFADQIGECLGEEPRQYTNSPFNDPAYLTQGINLLKNKYLVLEYHGPIKKEDLTLLGLDTDDSPLDQVYGEIWVCNSRVIRLQLSTIEGCQRLPYSACVWEPDPAMIFGFGIPMLARDAQRVVNEAYKMILDNAGVSAGPQVIIDTTIIKPSDGGNEVTPWKVWLSNEYGADLSKAIIFFTPPNSFDELSALLDKARQFADEESSINLLAAGGNTPAGAMDSATGLALLNENALTPLFFKSEEWDDKITRPTIEAMYDWEMQYNKKEEIKGTFDIDVRTTTAYLKGLMDAQKLDKLFQEIAQGSPVGEYVNMDALIEARLSIMKLPFADIVKSPQEVAQARASKPPPPPDPNMLKAQAMMQQNQIDAQRLALDQNRLQFEQQRHASDTALQAQVQQDTNAAKIREHQLDVTKAAVEAGHKGASLDVQAQQAQIAATAQTTTAAIQAHTDLQQAGMKHAAHLDNMTLQAQKIASQERQNHDKIEGQLRGIRVNAEARKKTVPNRDLTVHNPKPT